jgi:hypothetical protein
VYVELPRHALTNNAEQNSLSDWSIERSLDHQYNQFGRDALVCFQDTYHQAIQALAIDMD